MENITKICGKPEKTFYEGGEVAIHRFGNGYAIHRLIFENGISTEGIFLPVTAEQLSELRQLLNSSQLAGDLPAEGG